MNDKVVQKFLLKARTHTTFVCINVIILMYTVYITVDSSYIWGKPEQAHSNIENSTVVHAQRSKAKNGFITHYCSLIQWFVYKQT